MAEPAMHDLASAIVLYLGEQTGRAQRLKLLNNLLSATGMAASCEAFILGVKWGLDPQVMLDIINDGEASSSATRNKFPQAILPRRFDFGARMAITAKDTSLTVKESEELGVPMWIGQSVRQIWNYAASQGGWDKDGTSLITFLEPWAGVVVKGNGQKVNTPVAQAGAEMKPLLVACDEDMSAAITQRLREQQWDCPVVGVPLEGGRDAVLAAVTASGVTSAIVVNLCVMATSESALLAAAFAARGDIYLDAALTGTARDMAQGSRAVLGAGPSPAFEQARPLLATLGARVFHVSEKVGAAHLMQLIDGALFDTLLAATCESYVTGAKAGLAPLTMTKIMGVETGRNAASERIIPTEVATRRFDHGKRIGQACRELSLLSDEARQLGVTPWILDKARLLYNLAAQLGSPDDDITRIVTHYEAWAGAVVVTPTAQSDVRTNI
jgi:3-hydroxyisobutyrate dehydrogenase-like beta-hydroxyacid dehydrogenase